MPSRMTRELPRRAKSDLQPPLHPARQRIRPHMLLLLQLHCLQTQIDTGHRDACDPPQQRS